MGRSGAVEYRRHDFSCSRAATWTGREPTQVQPETNGKAVFKAGTPQVAALRSAAVLRTPADHIELSAPARPDSLQLVRLAAGFVAARADLVYDEVQDLRLAIDELCSTLLDPHGDPDLRLFLRCAWDEHCIEVTCTVSDAGSVDGSDMVPDPWASWDGGSTGSIGAVEAVDARFDWSGDGAGLSRQILTALVDQHGVVTGGGRRVGWLRKQRMGAPR